MTDGVSIFVSIAAIVAVFFILIGAHAFVLDVFDDLRRFVDNLPNKPNKPNKRIAKLNDETARQLHSFERALMRPRIQRLCASNEKIILYAPQETATDMTFTIECPATIEARHINNALDVRARNISKPGGPRRFQWSVPKENATPPSWRETFNRVKLTQFECLIGLDRHHAPLTCALDQLPSLAIFGDSGTGKTFAVHSLLCSLIARHSPDQLRLVIMDSKQARAGESRNFADYTYLPHTLKYYDDPAQIADCIDYVHNRLGQLRVGQSLVLLLEELPLLRQHFDDSVKDQLSNITRTGRELGVHCIATSQTALNNALPAGVVGMFPSRIVMRLRHEQELRQAHSEQSQIDNITQLKRSEGYAIIDGDESQRLYIPTFPDGDRIAIIADAIQRYPPPILPPEVGYGGGHESENQVNKPENSTAYSELPAELIELYRSLKNQRLNQRDTMNHIRKAGHKISHPKLKKLIQVVDV